LENFRKYDEFLRDFSSFEVLFIVLGVFRSFRSSSAEFL
jgi:hypothetical protein